MSRNTDHVGDYEASRQAWPDDFCPDIPTLMAMSEREWLAWQSCGHVAPPVPEAQQSPTDK